MPDENGVIVVDKNTLHEMVKLKVFANSGIAEKIKVVKLDFDDATEIFKDVGFKWMPTFDMEKVKLCEMMFGASALGENVEVKMVNTDSILDCSHMFEDAFIAGDPSWINNMVF